jgi:uncharacterized protein YdhG (YjbR/CyaY superfamily)
MQSKAKTVEEYLNELPDGRREQIEEVRNVILENLPEGYEEVMNWGMITYQVPLERYPDTYNKQPLMYAALASQKNHMAVYLSGIYGDEKLRLKFEEDYKKSGKKMDIGKSCVRFRKIENLPLDIIGKAIAAYDIDTYISNADKIFKSRKK